MNRTLSIFVGLAVIVAVIALVGLLTRAPQFADLREGLGRRTRFGNDEPDEVVEDAVET